MSLQLDLLFVIEYLDFGRSEKSFKEKNEVPGIENNNHVLLFQCSSMFISIVVNFFK